VIDNFWGKPGRTAVVNYKASVLNIKHIRVYCTRIHKMYPLRLKRPTKEWRVKLRLYNSKSETSSTLKCIAMYVCICTLYGLIQLTGPFVCISAVVIVVVGDVFNCYKCLFVHLISTDSNLIRLELRVMLSLA